MKQIINKIIKKVIIMADVKVVCRRCGKEARSNELILDPVYKMMVCQTCVKERRNPPKKVGPTPVEIQEKKKMEVDREDAALEKAYSQKMKNTIMAQKVDELTVKYTCPRCSYKFNYNTEKKTPGTCPYCGAEIFKFKVC
jgi:DNA-directed RNA polymerase subunit RPC12/RpoP